MTNVEDLVRTLFHLDTIIYHYNNFTVLTGYILILYLPIQKNGKTIDVDLNKLL